MRTRNRNLSAAAVAGIIPLVAMSAVVFAVATTTAAASAPSMTPELEASSSLQSDPRAVEIAEGVLETMGGLEAWNNTRYIGWTFFRGRQHYWDKWTGNHRIDNWETRDGKMRVVLFNINTKQGRVWEDGEEVTDPQAKAAVLEAAEGAWINDTYWMFMPYKLLDPGVSLAYEGDTTMADGREAHLLQLTFDNVGRTPQNRYLVCVAKDTGLVEQWSYFQNADDAEPGFTLPWTGWQRFGQIMLSTDRGRDHDWNIRVWDELPESVFTSPEPVGQN